MNQKILKSITIVFLLVLLVAGFCSCTNDESVDISTDSKKSLVVEVDGKTYTIEDVQDKTIQELLEDAKITLDDGDVLSLDMNKKLTDNFTVKILRRVTVTVDDSINNAQYTVALTGSTVADALAAVGIKLAENHAANYEMDQALEDNMKIVVSVKEEPETTEPYEEESDNDDYDYDDYDDVYTPPVVTKAPTTQAPTTQVPTTQAPTTQAPTTQAPTKPAEPTTSGRTVVSVEIYEDCDGSGHGVKVITYSDGTQEEVAF